MPPNLGGFFMVRSYYPSECHADYFDFERIEALKPAIEACGISTLSQSPMLGLDRKSGSAGMPRPISYAVFCLKKKDDDVHSVSSVLMLSAGGLRGGSESITAAAHLWSDHTGNRVAV